MGFFWPTWRADFPSGPTRFGRLIHWVGLLIAAPLAAAEAYSLFSGTVDGFTAGVVFVVAGGVYFAARGLRYAISGE